MNFIYIQHYSLYINKLPINKYEVIFTIGVKIIFKCTIFNDMFSSTYQSDFRLFNGICTYYLIENNFAIKMQLSIKTNFVNFT